MIHFVLRMHIEHVFLMRVRGSVDRLGELTAVEADDERMK